MLEDSDLAPANPPSPSPARRAQAVTEDLSEEISRSVEKEKGDEVKCTRISADNYRCNWWSRSSAAAYDNPGMGGLMVTTHRVRKSRFLKATKAAGRLVITEVSSGTGQ